MLKNTCADCSWNDLVTEEAALRRLGMGVVEEGRRWLSEMRLCGKRMTAAQMDARAVGAWDATDRESYVMWRSLAAAARRNESDSPTPF